MHITKNQILIALGLIVILAIVLFGNISGPDMKKQTNGNVKGVEIDNTDIPEKIELSEVAKPPVQINSVKINPAAKNVILIDQETGQVMYEKGANESVSIASTTKLTTTAIVLENPDIFDLKEVITVKKETALVPGSIMGLKPNEKITVENLLNGLLVVSGNDAARTLADHYGNIDDFVKKMNDKAEELGMTNSIYKDPAGYEDEGKSSARDLAIIASYDLKFPKFREIIKKTEFDIFSTDGVVKHHMKNSNRLVDPSEPLYLPNAIGMKTGFTLEAGHCLVSAATKNNHTIISVVLNTNSSTNDASARVSREVLNWGLTNWSWD
ncbi:MAG: D-alanyl-D-alanine carboxypeptidase family protein [Patescibacteria group bacterium]|jgi:D-alanyl-D-alanine carboxypeptidase